jgi:hypothetical protein
MKRGKKINGLAIQFIPYSEIKDLNSDERIKKIFGIILSNNVIILQGRLKPEEETRLIGDTMAIIGHIKNFKGVELAVISGDSEGGLLAKIKKNLANRLSGGDTSSITIIGPATIVKEIKRNPKKIELLFN